ncbi:MAG: hypothetical protein LBQ48_07830 [Oscillospiraceae bacterium]|nr:hypothetical protein [Oscillospiraceae bacterium]
MKVRSLLVFSFLALPFMLVVRMFQYAVLTEPQTGFYFPKYVAWGTVIFTAFVLISAAYILISRFILKVRHTLPARSRGLFAGNAFMAVVMGYEALAAAVWVMLNYRTQSLVYTGGNGWNKTLPAVFSAVDWGGLLLAVFAALSAVGFVFEALRYKKSAQPKSLLTVPPVLWSIMKLSLCFIRSTGLASISENLFDTLFLCLLTVFWLLHARIAAGIGRDTTVKWVYGVGLSATLFGVAAAIPRLFILIAPRLLFTTADIDSILRNSESFDPVFLAVCVYIPLFLIVLGRRPKAQR